MTFSRKNFLWQKQTREHCVFRENAFLERWPFRSIKKIHTKVSRSVDIFFCLNSFGGKIPPQFSRFFKKYLPPGRSSNNRSLFSTSCANLSDNCKDKDCSLEGSVRCITIPLKKDYNYILVGIFFVKTFILKFLHSVGSSILAMSSSLIIILATIA